MKSENQQVLARRDDIPVPPTWDDDGGAPEGGRQQSLIPPAIQFGLRRA